MLLAPLYGSAAARAEPRGAANGKHVALIARCVAKAEQQPEKFSPRLATCFEGLSPLALLDAPFFSDSGRAPLTTHVRGLALSVLLRRVDTIKPPDRDVAIRRLLAERPLPAHTLQTLSGSAPGQRALFELMISGSTNDQLATTDKGAIASQLSRVLAARDRDRVLGAGADAKIRAATWAAYLADRSRTQKVAIGAIGNGVEYADAVIDLVQAAIDRNEKLQDDDLWVLGVNPAMSQGKPLMRLTDWASASNGYAERFQALLFTMLHQVIAPAPRPWDALLSSPELALAAKVAASGAASAPAKKSALVYLADHVERPAAKPFEALVVDALQSPDVELSQAAVRIAMTSFTGNEDVARRLARWLIGVSTKDSAGDVSPLWVEVGIWLEAQSKQDFGFRKASRLDRFACGYDQVQRSGVESDLQLVGGKALAKHLAKQKVGAGPVDLDRGAAVAADNEERQARLAAFQSARSALATRWK